MFDRKIFSLYFWLFNLCLIKGKPLELTEEQLNEKIIGGIRAVDGAYPFQVSIQADGSAGRVNFCGGSILKRKWVLTAAHCVDEFHLANWPKMFVKAGSVDVTPTSEADEQYNDVLHMHKHPQYTGPYSEFDIALLEMAKPFNFTKRVQAVDLPPSGHIPVGDGQLIGWGGVANPSDLHQSQYLMTVNVTIATNEYCRKYYPKLTDKQFCPGGNRKGACGGDSGGPMVQTDVNNITIIVGVDSYSKRPCGWIPSVFVRVSAYVDDFILPKITDKTN